MHVFGFPFHEGPRPARVRINRTVLFVLSVIWVLSVGAPAFAKTPPVGDKAPDFTSRRILRGNISRCVTQK
jgi:hypothetical protein